MTALVFDCFVAAVFSSGFLLWQLALIFTGMTSHELKNGPPAHSICHSSLKMNNCENSSQQNEQASNWNGILANFKDIFGPFWYITIVLPIPTSQDGHGLYKQIFSVPDDMKYSSTKQLSGKSNKTN